MNQETNIQTYLDIHRLMSEEMRHTSTVIWQFSVAVITLQGGAIGLSSQQGFAPPFGNVLLLVGFVLSLLFSLFLVRQARERQGFKARIQAVEAELRKTFPQFYTEITSTLNWLKSGLLAWALALESFAGVIWCLTRFGLFHCCVE